MSGERNEPGTDEVGTVAEEAVRLLGALTDWAKDTGHHLGHDLDAHLATGAPECTVCPLCRTLHTVRQVSPEVRTQLATAATSLLQAASGLIAAAVPDQGPARGGVEHIDLDEGPDDWPDDGDQQTDPEEEDR